MRYPHMRYMPREVHADEMYARGMHAHEIHTGEIYAHRNVVFLVTSLILRMCSLTVLSGRYPGKYLIRGFST